MSSFRATGVVSCLAALTAAAALTGCASSRLTSAMPPGAHLAGDWRLDAAQSDDLGRAVTQLREQARKRREKALGRRMGGMSAHRGGQEGPGGGQGEERDGDGPQSEGPAEEAAIGPGPQVSAADELLASVPQGDYLRINASPGAFTVISGSSSDQYTPGLPSEISAQQGDAQQISGWKGLAYVIDTRPQWGPQIKQSYDVIANGRLRLTVELTGRDTHFVFTRIYDRTTSVSPLAPPTND